jgi:hypothetical protein
MKNEKYYIYLFLDPNKKGEYIYGNYKFEYEPFYVGKGRKYETSSSDRINTHFRPSSLKKNTYKNNKIKKILNDGQYPIIVKVKENIDEPTAFIIEKEIILAIGRYKTKTGPLTNQTDGGEGPSGIKRKKASLATRKKISESLIGKRGRNTGNKHTEETKKQISETKKGTLSWNATPVLQLTKDDELVKEWVSATAAAKELKLSQGNIWSVINGGRNTCGGYKWRLKKV